MRFTLGTRLLSQASGVYFHCSFLAWRCEMHLDSCPAKQGGLAKTARPASFSGVELDDFAPALEYT